MTQRSEVPVTPQSAVPRHAQLCSDGAQLQTVKYSHDHVSIEPMFFDGKPESRDGALHVEASCRGLDMLPETARIERCRARL